jgi:hypothetical protein
MKNPLIRFWSLPCQPPGQALATRDLPCVQSGPCRRTAAGDLAREPEELGRRAGHPGPDQLMVRATSLFPPWFGVLGAGLALLPACKLPDVSDFCESAAALRSGLEEAEAAYAPFVAGSLSLSKQKEFADSWSTIEGSADALVAYAQSLDAIVAGGNKGEAGAKELAKSVDTLVTRVGAVGIATSEIASVMADVWGLAAKGIAAKQLAEATGEAHPYVDAICRILADKVASNLADDFDTICEQAKSEIDGRYPDVSGAWDLLIARRGRLTGSLASADPASWTPAVIQELDSIDSLLVRLRPQAEEWKKDIRDAERLRDLQKSLMLQIGVAARALAAEHGSLKAAILANRSISLNHVMHAANGLKALVVRIQEVKDNG